MLEHIDDFSALQKLSPITLGGGAGLCWEGKAGKATGSLPHTLHPFLHHEIPFQQPSASKLSTVEEERAPCGDEFAQPWQQQPAVVQLKGDLQPKGCRNVWQQAAVCF